MLDATGRSTLESPRWFLTFVKEVRISAQMKNDPGYKYRALGSSKQVGLQRFHTDLTVWDDKTKKEVVSIIGWSTKSLGSGMSTTDAKTPATP